MPVIHHDFTPPDPPKCAECHRPVKRSWSDDLPSYCDGACAVAGQPDYVITVESKGVPG